MFRKFMIAAVAALSLAGCAQFQSFEASVKNAYQVVTSTAITPNEAYIAINAYDAAAVTATNFNKLSPCAAASAPCRPAGIRAQIRKFVLSGRVARNQVKAYLRANPGQNLAINSLDDLKAATSSLQSIIAAYKTN